MRSDQVSSITAHPGTTAERTNTMKFELEIDVEDVKKSVIAKIAEDYKWQIGTEVKNEIFDKIDWSKMAPFVQEAILKMAAQKMFGGGS